MGVNIDPGQLGKRIRDLEGNQSNEQRKNVLTEVVPHFVDAKTAEDWTAALQKLNKGKTTLGRQVHIYSHGLCRGR